MNIDITKKYRTRSGDPVRILCVDRTSKTHPVVALIKKIDREASEVLQVFTLNGRYFYSPEVDFQDDLVEVSPFEEFKDGDMVMVRQYGIEGWKPRHFYKVEGNKVLCYMDGASKWGSSGSRSYKEWDECRLPTQEELKAKGII